MTQPYQSYQRVAVSTADPLRIVVLLYEGAIKNLHQAEGMFARQDADTASARINRTLDILNYLRSALDHTQGGEIASRLQRLYEYMRDTLAHANIHRDSGQLREVIGLLQTLLEGWRGITQPAPGAEAPAPGVKAIDSQEEVLPFTPQQPTKSLSMFIG